MTSSTIAPPVAGGHITDGKDRRLCNAFLLSYVREELLDNLAFFPKFDVPPATSSHKQYCEYIEERLAVETPLAYGLHPNSEIGFMTRQADALFAAVAELQPRAGGGGAACRCRPSQRLPVTLSSGCRIFSRCRSWRSAQ